MLKRYGAPCDVCGVVRDFHTPFREGHAYQSHSARLDLTRASFDQLVEHAGDLHEAMQATLEELDQVSDPATRHALQDDLRRLSRDFNANDRIIGERFFRRREDS